MKRILQAFGKTSAPQPSNHGTVQLSITSAVVEQIKNDALEEINTTLEIKKTHLAILQVQKNLEAISKKEMKFNNLFSDFCDKKLSDVDFLRQATPIITNISLNLANEKKSLLAAKSGLTNFINNNQNLSPQLSHETEQLKQSFNSVHDHYVIITQTYGAQQKIVKEMAEQGLMQSTAIRNGTIARP